MAQIEETMLEMLKNTRSGSTRCPSEVPRRLRPANWRPLMDATRDVARRLASQGLVQILQKGQVRLVPHPHGFEAARETAGLHWLQHAEWRRYTFSGLMAGACTATTYQSL